MQHKVAVVGGVYREWCALPSVDRVIGSGGRGAGYLSSAGETLSLYFPSDGKNHRITGLTRNVDKKPQASQSFFRFDYLHPLARPIIDGAIPDNRPIIQVEGDMCLAYGMLEARFEVTAEKVVIDPQSSERFTEVGYLGEVYADRVAYVMNRTEASSLVGRDLSPEELAEKAREITGSEICIVKAGVHGVAGSSVNGNFSAPSYHAKHHHKIGSGDVFSAAFFKAWCIEGIDAAEAARYASAATALFLETDAYVADATRINAKQNDPLKFSTKRVYLAGSFFDVGSRWRTEESLRILIHNGHDVLSPVHSFGMADKNNKRQIALDDLNLLNASEVVFANIPDFDEGSLLEIGYAIANDKHVVAYIGEHVAPDTLDSRYTMLHHPLVKMHTGFCDAITQIGWN